jgi:tetratricopeptide (TPR) repeat protein
VVSGSQFIADKLVDGWQVRMREKIEISRCTAVVQGPPAVESGGESKRSIMPSCPRVTLSIMLPVRRLILAICGGIRFVSLFLLFQAVLLHALSAGPRNLLSVAASLPVRPLMLRAEQIADQAAANPAAIFRQGMQALQTGQFAIAEKEFQNVIVLDPKSSAAHINLAVVYMREKRWDDALVELHKAASLSPNEPGILLNIGLVNYRKNDFTSAIRPFSAILQQTPDSHQARYLLGLCYFFNGKYAEATNTLIPLWPVELNNLNYLYVVSIAAGKSTNGEFEKRAFDQMLAVGQNKPEFHLYMGKAWLAEDNTAKALEEFKAAAATRPNLPLVHYFLGRTYLELHDDSLAEEELQKDVSIEPDFAYNYEDLGILYGAMDQPDKAELSFRKAVELDGTLVNSYLGLAKLYRQASRYRDALSMLDHAVAVTPQSASVHFLRAQVLAHLGQAANAQQEFDTSARLLKLVNEQVQQNLSGDHSADAQGAAQQ